MQLGKYLQALLLTTIILICTSDEVEEQAGVAYKKYGQMQMMV